ncbi:hypothetical protein JTE90_016975 [Oedothorax gibbosus]|uniref:Solute carrier family 66 member 3 n=1 Tax=Oedothorax gibbosus TaxID=931172 RepID=A0AAV6UFJ1_9ARAC|nr:hypothetical protein JTE90_016975 [Oedothorax gibbosus]
MSDKCYNEFFVKFNFFEVECLKETISKALGTGIILGSALGYPFSSWGESCFLLIETAMIGFLVLMYGSRSRNANAFAAFYSLIVYMMFAGIVPMSVLTSMQIGNVPIIVVAKMIQATKNYSNGHTGQLSAITVNLLFLGAVARIFTSIQETGDPIIIFTFIIATLFNGILAGQVFYYRKATAKVLKAAEKKIK